MTPIPFSQQSIGSSATVASVSPAAVELNQRFDQLLQTYQHIERLLTEYRGRLLQGQLATDLLTKLYRYAEESSTILASLPAVQPALADCPQLSATEIAEKKQQVLQTLSRVLQCLALAEQHTRELSAQWNPQAEALYQATSLRQAYQLALATCLPARANDVRAATSPNTDHADHRSAPGADSAASRAQREEP
ncbi:hypothetical protein HRbin36_00973 [bacterium HR36]|nr:hypothetical protein HRbin36_00973 [bacterium HR36]